MGRRGCGGGVRHMWKDAYLIGDAQIDQQHKQLIGLLDDLLKSENEGEEKLRQQCRSTVRFLKDYSVHHFSSEEMLQQRIGFPFAEEHHKLHEDFKVKLHEIDLDLIRSEYSMEKIREVVSFLTHWWLFHIIREDKKMIEYMP